jgi:hypothetical protein
MNGATESVREFSWLNDGRTSLPVQLAPGEIKLFLVHESHVEPHVDSANFEVEEIRLAGRSVQLRGHVSHPVRQVQAFLDLGGEMLELRGGECSSPELSNVTKAWRCEGTTGWLPFTRWEFRPGGMARSLLERLLDRSERQWLALQPDTISAECERRGRNGKVLFRTRFTARKVEGTLHLFAELLPGERRFFLNHREVELSPQLTWGWEWGHALLTGQLRNGTNELAIEVQNVPEEYRELCASPGVVGLYGEFVCDLVSPQLSAVPREIDLPDGAMLPANLLAVPDGLNMITSFVLPPEKSESHFQLEIASARGRVELTVNGVTLPAQIFPPYCFEVTPFLVSGENRLQVRIDATDLTLFLGVGRHTSVFGPVQLVISPLVLLRGEKRRQVDD